MPKALLRAIGLKDGFLMYILNKNTIVEVVFLIKISKKDVTGMHVEMQ
jgi:hypothetical protein